MYFSSNFSSGFVAICPLCGNDIVENSKGYGCRNWHGGCGVMIYHDIKGHKVSLDEALDLLDGKTIGPFSDFINREGKAFTASLVMDEKTGKAKLLFGKRKVEKDKE